MSNEATFLMIVFTGAVPTLMILAMWIERRKTQGEQHMQNRIDIAELMTMVRPMWEWWTKNGKH